MQAIATSVFWFMCKNVAGLVNTELQIFTNSNSNINRHVLLLVLLPFIETELAR